jgi:hypothetical protein
MERNPNKLRETIREASAKDAKKKRAQKLIFSKNQKPIPNNQINSFLNSPTHPPSHRLNKFFRGLMNEVRRAVGSGRYSLDLHGGL